MTNLTPETVDELTYCYKHPKREATLRCIRCDRYICSDCLMRTPTGYTCKECARQADAKFFHGKQSDLAIHVAACAVLMGGAAGLIWYSGIASSYILFSVFLGPFVGGAVAEMALRLTERRRALNSDRFGTAAAAVGGVLGALLTAFIYILTLTNSNIPTNYNMQSMQMFQDLAQANLDGTLRWAVQAVFLNINYMVFLVLAVGSVYGRFQVRI